jgi:tRNA modification GTPase
MPRPSDTIAALATPVGTAALAVLRVSGPDTHRLAKEIFRRTPPPRLAHRADYRDRGGSLIDDTMVTIFQGPRSYTGEDAMEICCHGNPFIAQKILEDLYARGCRPAGPGEFTQRALLNGRMDLSQAEAVMDVIHARSERALAMAHQQLRGALGEKMNELIDRLLGLLARIEAYIDFPDEDLPPEDRDEVIRELSQLSQETDRLLATRHYGELLRDGIKVVIVGEPNVGKSSLLNRLVGRNRALVSPEPGTTRDYLEERIMLGAHSIRLIDTAGINSSPAPLERLGIEKTHERLAEADIVLVVIDASAPIPMLSSVLRGKLGDKRHVIVLNKSDLGDHVTRSVGHTEFGQAVLVSALTGFGVDQLVDAIARLAETFQTEIGIDAIVVNARHSSCLGEARSALCAAVSKLEASDPIELISCDLRGCLASYGEIAGKVDNERMLDQLFIKFCIGK